MNEASSQKSSFVKSLIEAWQELQDNQPWKYEELPPAQLLEKLKLDAYATDKDELARAELLWSQRPHLRLATSYIVWLIVALGMPFWLFIIPEVGLPLLIIWVVESTWKYCDLHIGDASTNAV